MNYSKIIIDFLLERPFFGVVLSRLQLRDDSAVQTAATDGRTIWINSEWADTLTQTDQMGLLAHEVLHVALQHPLRRQGRNALKWNIACDMAINPLVIESGFSLPPNGLFDEHKPPRSAEEIYPEITDDMVARYAWWGEVVDTPVGAGDMAGEAERITVMLSEAYRRSAGRLPATLERVILSQVAPPVPWKNILENYVVTAVRESYSVNRFNRRFIRNNIYLPALHSTKLQLAVAVDTSGSIGNEQLAEIAGVIEDIRAQIAKMVITVLYCDAKLQRRETFEEGDICCLRPKGGGGTDFRPVFAELKRDDVPPDVLIYLTDGYGAYPERAEVEFPVIWVLLRKKGEIEIEYW